MNPQNSVTERGSNSFAAGKKKAGVRESTPAFVPVKKSCRHFAEDINSRHSWPHATFFCEVIVSFGSF